VGEVQPLVYCEERVLVVQSLLRALNSSDAVLKVLATPHFAVYNNQAKAGHFKRIVLTPRGCAQESALGARRLLIETLFQALLDHPPTSLEWLTPAYKNAIFDTSRTVADLLPNQLIEKHMAQLLALRGMLGFGMLESALEKRNRVHYGLDRERSQRTGKRIAVPFIAADVPSSRSEFSHPDATILLTTLAYYNEGLRCDEVREALRKLLELGPTARAYYYAAVVARLSLSAEEALVMDDVGKIDFSNSAQMALIADMFCHNTEMINFFLSHVVLSRDTGQYPQRIVSNSWNIAASSHVVGFSGTKDNHLLLPLQVSQREPEIPQLLGADARIIHILLQQKVMLIAQGHTALFDACIGYDALIDTGSLQAGQNMRLVADQLLARCNQSGVMFYSDGWQILPRRGRCAVPRTSSALKDSECFIVFDQARTRGSDTTMHADAKAVLTLGQGLVREKLVQGAGRLRKFGKNQSVVMVGTEDVLQGMSRPKEVLEWVLRNTSLEMEQGMAEWAAQGIQFTCGEPFIDEDWSLERLYANAVGEESLSEAVRRTDHSINAQAIVERCDLYGENVRVRKSVGADECERELQLEEKREEEQEEETVAVHPKLEIAWDYSTAHRAIDVSGVGTECMLLGNSLPPELGWERFQVYATKNFLCTCGYRDVDERRVHRYLRRAWGMLQLGSQLLLLSEMEANGMCEDPRFVTTVRVKSVVVELYNGETQVKDKRTLGLVTADQRARKVLREIVRMRGLDSFWSCSDLERACELG